MGDIRDDGSQEAELIEREVSATNPSAWLDIQGVVTADCLWSGADASSVARWSLDNLSGRLVELSGGADTAALTMVVRFVVEAQRRGEPVVWVSMQESSFFPPDMAAAGVDLHALPVVCVKHQDEIWRMADLLLRSGGFALVIVDLGWHSFISLAAQTRLAGLVRKSGAVMIAITRRRRVQMSLGSLTSLWGCCVRTQTAFNQFRCEWRALKDKHAGPGWRYHEWCHGADGLC